MSELGQKRTLSAPESMSAPGCKADIELGMSVIGVTADIDQGRRDVCFVPCVDGSLLARVF